MKQVELPFGGVRFFLSGAFLGYRRESRAFRAESSCALRWPQKCAAWYHRAFVRIFFGKCLEVTGKFPIFATSFYIHS